MPLTKITHIREGKKLIQIGFSVYYDDEADQYKVRFSCNECGDIAGCMCYNTLLDAAFNEDILLCGKRICFVSANFDLSDDEYLIPHVPLNECTEDELSDLYDDYITDIEEGWHDEIMSPEKMPCDLTSDEVDEVYDILLDFDFEGNVDSAGVSCK